VIQKREDGSVDFDQSWEKYEHGFGKLESKYALLCHVMFPSLLLLL